MRSSRDSRPRSNASSTASGGGHRNSARNPGLSVPPFARLPTVVSAAYVSKKSNISETANNEFVQPGPGAEPKVADGTDQGQSASLAGRPAYDPIEMEKALDRFAAAGAIAWADVPDAVQWVREQRGG